MTTTPHDSDAVSAMVDSIRPGDVVTWLNHWSLQHADWAALAQMDVIGFDGTLLQLTLLRLGRPVGRSSADLVLPPLLARLPPGSRVALVGAAPGVAARAAARLEHYGHTILHFDGYGDLLRLREDPAELVAFAPDLLVVGLGAGLQDRTALEFHRSLPAARILTAGGWLDQTATAECYFPPWVHRARLGWAWRIAHEPRRLLGRYTVDAARFQMIARSLVAQLVALGGTFDVIGLDRRIPEESALPVFDSAA